jgi:hypothetical protein
VKLLRDETGAGTLVTGAYYLVDDSLQFRAMVTDAQLGTLLEAPPPVTVSRDSAAQAIRMLRARVLGALAVRRDAGTTPQPDLGAAPPMYEAYRAFDAALARFMEQDYAAAAPALLAAHALDTTFNAPLLYAASAYWNLRDYATTASLVRRLRAPGTVLSAYQRDATEYLDAALAGEGERALAAIRRAADEAPGSRAHYILAAAALEMDRPREALESLQRMDPNRGVMRGWSSYWTQLAHAHHLLGDHARELQAARELRRRFPDRRVGWVLEARALAATGHVIALDSLMEAQRSLPPTTYWSQGAAMVNAGEELRAHGFPAAGRAFLERGRRWLEGELAVNPRDRMHREWLAYALYGERRWTESERLWSALAAEYPDRVRYRGNAALCAAHLGRPGAGRRLVPHHPVERGTITYYRGIVAAIHGDPNRATSLLADAVRLGVDGLPWLHASSHDDLALLASVRGALPQSLRTGPAPAPPGVP